MSKPSIYVRVTDRPIEVAAAQEFLSDPSHGAMDLFIGAVRDTHQGKVVSAMTYDVHAPLAQRVLEEICQEARMRWPETRYYVVHFQGDLKVGETSILIGVGSAHRAEAFEACRHVIEEVKKRAPVWKREHYLDGLSAWLPGHSLAQDQRRARVGGVVLAGGKSSRMGQNKALMPYRGKPLVAHMSDLLRQAGCDDVFVGGGVPGIDSLADAEPFCGPARAMTDLLRRFAGRYDRLAFVPVDMPLLEVEALRCLIRFGVGACFEGYPLPAVLETGEVPGASSVRDLLVGAGARVLPLSPAWERGMVNINTKREWEALAS